MKNKKTIPVILSAVIIVCLVYAANVSAADTLELDDSVRLNDMVITLLTPLIQSAADDFYEPYLTIKTTVVPYYGSKIVQIQGGELIREGISNSNYTVTVEVFPYVGPHISVGKDRVTLTIQPCGAKVSGYEHVESYSIPQHYQSIIKKPLQ